MTEAETLQEKMALLMLRKGYNMRSLSKAAGFSDTYVYDWLRRGAKPRREHLEKIAEILGVPIGEILNDLELSEEEEAIILQYRSLMSQDREALRRLADFLAAKGKKQGDPGEPG